MPDITNLTDMKNYVLRQLGYPVNNIEITEEQLEDAIDDTVRDANRYLGGEGNFTDYIIFNTSAGQTNYPLSSTTDANGNAIDNIEAIYDFSVSFGLDGINTLFSPTHILLYNMYVNQGSYPGGPGAGSSEGLVLSNYQTAMMYLDEINRAFGKGYIAKYIPGREVIQIIPTPNKAMTAVLIVFRKEYAHFLYNNPLVRKLAVARAKIRWGNNLAKYNGTLPDGLSINADAIVSQGKEEEEKWFERLWEEGEPPGIIVA